MRIAVDTNVLVSATFWYGASYRIIELVERKEIELILSKDIIEEFAAVLEYDEIQTKVKNKNLEMKRTVETIVSISTVVIPKQRFDVVKEDPDDNKILDCAVEGRVDCIISQDNHLLKLGAFKGIRIVAPDDFLKEIATSVRAG